MTCTSVSTSQHMCVYISAKISYNLLETVARVTREREDMTGKYYGALDDRENILDERQERVSDCDDTSIEGSEDSDALLGQVGDSCNNKVRNSHW